MSARMTGGWRYELMDRAREGREVVRLCEPLVWGVEGPDGPTFITVPKDFESDFASMPWVALRMLPSFGPWARAAVLHDYLYVTFGEQGRWTRAQADDIFKQAMEAIADSRIDREPAAWKRFAIHRAVRLFGKGGWGH